MIPVEVNFYLFIAVSVVFACIGFSAAKRQKSVSDYFHHSSLTKNVFSLSATNITLGTGLVYLITGAQRNGLLMLLPVFCVGIGYWLLSEFIERAASITTRSGKNFLASVDAEIRIATGKSSIFAIVVSLSLVFVFVLLLAFEIFASSKVISPFLFKTPRPSSEVALSILIFCVTVLYALLGGIRATFGVDFVQVPLICLFLPIFVISAIPEWNHPIRVISRLGENFKTDANVVVAIVIACMNSLATQFYSLLNWGAVSNMELSNQRKMLRRVGLATTVVLAFFVLVGLLHQKGTTGEAWQDLVMHFSTLGHSVSIKGYLFSGIITLGMASILLTTTDAVVVNCVLFTYDNVFGGDSKAIESNPRALRTIRLIGTVAFGACFAVLCAINYLQPDPFYLLLSMAGGVVVFAPMIITAGFLASKNNSLKVFTRWVVLAYLSIFIAAGIADVIFLTRRSSLVPYIGLSSFIAASILSLVLLLRMKLNGTEGK